MYGKCKPLSSLNLFISYVPQMSGENPVSLFTLLLAFPQLLSKHSVGASGSIHWIAALGALIQIWRPEIADSCDISCLSIQQEIFSFHSPICLSLPFGPHLCGTNDCSSQFPPSTHCLSFSLRWLQAISTFLMQDPRFSLTFINSAHSLTSFLCQTESGQWGETHCPIEGAERKRLYIQLFYLFPCQRVKSFLSSFNFLSTCYIIGVARVGEVWIKHNFCPWRVYCFQIWQRRQTSLEKRKLVVGLNKVGFSPTQQVIIFHHSEEHPSS